MLHRPIESATSDTALMGELVAVLSTAPGGLRRWSVMNAIRKNRRASGRDIPLKMEADIERAFRRFCAADGARDNTSARFRRPVETAGEVWALNPDWTPAVEI